jgi:hypothetical protein
MKWTILIDGEPPRSSAEQRSQTGPRIIKEEFADHYRLVKKLELIENYSFN